MSKKNYNKISTEKKMAQEAIIENVENSETPVVEEVVETKPEPKTVMGVVTNCTMLNVRKEADINGKVLCTVPVHSEVEVVATVAGDWYHVVTESGIEGFCMKKYIVLQK